VTALSKARVISSAVVILGTVSAAPRPLHAATPSEVRSLRGLSGVEVVIENLTEEERALGLKAEQLQGDVQSRLRESGIRVLTSDDRAPGRPWLYMRVFTLKSTSVPLVSFFVVAQLHQDATLERNPDSHLGATTWDAGAGGLAGLGAIAEAVSGTVRDLAEKFSGDFLAVNAGR